jgi:hypothetical protein
MIEQSLLLKLSAPGLADDTTSRLRQEYQVYQALFQAQSSLGQQYLGSQAASITEAVLRGSPALQFSLPDMVNCSSIQDECIDNENLPEGIRQQHVGRGRLSLSPMDLRQALDQRLSALERSMNRALSVSAMLLRYSVATHMVYHVLPAGNTVIYRNADPDDIPNQPDEKLFNESIKTLSIASSAGMKYSHLNQSDQEVSAPYIPAAQRFYLPQWVAFGDQRNLLLGSVSEAEAILASMQRYLYILQSALLIAPFMIADDTFQQKRYGMLGQLVNQGRALANYQVSEIVQTIKTRVAEHRLDRGLSISLPYFDDHKLRIEFHKFIVIPAGRVMFVPAFVVLAAREQQIKVAEHSQLNISTRKHLLAELHDFELAFIG